MAEGARKLRHINGLRQVPDEGRSASSRPWLLSKSSSRSRKLPNGERFWGPFYASTFYGLWTCE